MINTILVPTDGSVLADKAVSLAGELAKMYGAKIVLLHALPDIINELIPESYREFANAEHKQIGDVLISVGEQILRRAEAQLRAQGVDMVTFSLPRGPAAKAILDYAKEHPVDMVVMGSRGLGDLQGLLMGSVSHNVSQLSPCSCITVK